MKKLIRRIAIVLAAIGLGVAMVPVGQASADTLCLTGYFCIFDQPNYSGTVVRMSPGSCKNMPYPWADNMMESYWNASNAELWLYDGPNCTGTFLNTAYPHFGQPNMGWAANRLSSFKVSPL